MNYNMCFDICALFVGVIMLMTYYYRKTIVSYKARIFEALLWLCFGAAAADIIAAFANAPSCPMMIKWISNMVYYSLHAATNFFGVLYFILMAEPMVKMSNMRKIHLFLPFAAEIVLIAFNPILRLLFYFDENGTYQRGGGVWICYAITVYYFVYMIVFLLKHTDFFDKKMQIVITMFSVMYILPMVLQYFFPSLLLECFAATLFILVIYILYQTEDNSIDNQTKLLSYQAFESDCKAYAATNMNFSVLMIKIRDAKFLTDAFGNQFCTKVYASFANYISQFVRYGNAYSLGGGIFALCFINENVDPKNVLESITERMKQPWGFEEIITRLSVSVSIISYPMHAADYQSFMELADTVFFRSDYKPDIIYADKMVVKDKRRRSDIERAIASGNVTDSLEIFYQPIYSNKEKRFTGVEALVRMRDRLMGYVMPDEFIPIAEKSGAMMRIGEYIFENICKYISSHDTDVFGIKFFTVNLSVMQCMQTDLVAQMASIMQKYGVNPSKICFEISEIAATDPPDVMINNIKQLHKLGVSFSLDNYGTGQSGLQQLTLLPLRMIKFDSSFIKRAMNDPRERTILQSSVNMSKSIRIEAVASGIENENMYSQMQEFGFDFCQGFYYAPVCSEEDLPGKLVELSGQQK